MPPLPFDESVSCDVDPTDTAAFAADAETPLLESEIVFDRKVQPFRIHTLNLGKLQTLAPKQLDTINKQLTLMSEVNSNNAQVILHALLYTVPLCLMNELKHIKTIVESGLEKSQEGDEPARLVISSTEIIKFLETAQRLLKFQTKLTSAQTINAMRGISESSQVSESSVDVSAIMTDLKKLIKSTTATPSAVENKSDAPAARSRKRQKVVHDSDDAPMSTPQEEAILDKHPRPKPLKVPVGLRELACPTC